MFNLEKSISEWRQQMLIAGIKAPVPLEELESHLREDIERRVKSGADEQTAFETAIRHFGKPKTLNGEFQKSERIILINHNRIYPWVLATLAIVAGMSSGFLFFVARATAGDSSGIKLPAGWSLPWVAAINFAYTIAIVIVLYVRRYKPESGRSLTRLLNWALLPAFPGGTAVGIYGLWTQRDSDLAV